MPRLDMHAFAALVIVIASVPLAPRAMAADDGAPGSAGAVGISALVAGTLSGKTLSIGLDVAQATYKAHEPTHGDVVDMTDNGAPGLILVLASRERSLAAWRLATGHAVLGWDVNATLGSISTRYQTVDSAIRGRDIGTRVTGLYLGVAPTLFFKLGPLAADHPVFWKLSLGLGPGLLRASGTAEFGSTGQVETVGSKSPRLGLYSYGSVQLQIGHWEYGFTGKSVSEMNGKPSIESYGIGMDYRLGF